MHTIVGMTTASMIARASRRITRSASPTGPAGSSTPRSQPDNAAITRIGTLSRRARSVNLIMIRSTCASFEISSGVIAADFRRCMRYDQLDYGVSTSVTRSAARRSDPDSNGAFDLLHFVHYERLGRGTGDHCTSGDIEAGAVALSTDTIV